jgi:hypothetical protein
MSRDADSAGRPWAGRHFTPSGFEADDGRAAPELAAALHDFGQGVAGPAAVVDAVRAARLLIPLVAQLGDSETVDGRTIDKTQELSIVTVAGPDGRTVLPAFSSVDTMRAWDPKARPIPVAGPRVALAAAGEGTDLVVLDAGSESEFVIRRPAVWAIARSEAWLPSFEDPAVEGAFAASIGRELAIYGARLSSGDPRARLAGPELIVRLTVARGLSREDLDVVLARLAARWAADDVIATRVDSLKVELVVGEATPESAESR